jgi:hypothetical protein
VVFQRALLHRAYKQLECDVLSIEAQNAETILNLLRVLDGAFDSSDVDQIAKRVAGSSRTRPKEIANQFVEWRERSLSEAFAPSLMTSFC